MAVAMKSWHVTVLQNNFKQIECIKCVSAAQATEKLKEMKEKYVSIPKDPTSSNQEIATKGITYTFFREQF